VPRDPEESSRPIGQTFDPTILDRTVIAIPLRGAMEDVDRALKWLGGHEPERVENYNTVIYLARDFPGGLRAADRELRRLLAKTQEEVGEGEAQLEPEVRTRGQRQFRFGRMDRHVRVILTEQDRESRFRAIERIWPTKFDVIIDVNLRYPQGRDKAREWIIEWIMETVGPSLKKEKMEFTNQYVFARMSGSEIRQLVQSDTNEANERQKKRGPTDPQNPDFYRAIHSVWPDFPIRPCITKSVSTVKADAAQSCFAAFGNEITWAVIDSGIDADHPHFRLRKNVDLDSDLHKDFTRTQPANLRAGRNPALIDNFGHGTHVAGIIAGEHDADEPDGVKETLLGLRRQHVDQEVRPVRFELSKVRSVAPCCRLVSLKVLDDVGVGIVGNVIAALGWVMHQNGNGVRDEMRIHGVNISLGYEFDPEWFACGESPVCNEVNRLVRAGVVVVVAAGNTGFGTLASSVRATKAGLGVTINDPGNAELAITVGSTHRDMPHRYGVSYFSSKGPTGDGRPKPDLVAPGEKILSCAIGALLRKKLRGVTADSNQAEPNQVFRYVEESGTSMAAPHVSGVIAAFLSVRGEFIGQPERLKLIFLSTATNLQRDRYFQGAGLVDLMRAIQSV
jgi:serine protease AprX